MQHAGSAERRRHPRFDVSGLSVSLRIKGRLSRLQGSVLDFNRHGIAVCIDQPISKDKQCFISIHLAGSSLHDIVGVVHNCTTLPDGYRCGIQFRTESDLQFDQDAVHQQLDLLEQMFSDAIAAAG